jgi:flotillin
MPPMMQVMKDVGGVEVPEFLAKLQSDVPAAVKVEPTTNGVAAK